MYHGVSKLELYVHTRPMMAPADSLLQACEHLDVDLISSCLRQEHANAVVPGDRGGHTLLYHVVDRQITPFGEDLRPIPAGSPPPESDFHSTAARVNIIVKKFTDLGADVHRIGQMYNVPRGLDPSYIRRADARLTREPVLVCACRQGLAPVVHTLLAAHANPNSMGDDGISSLMQATISGAAGCVSALLAAGADPNYSVFSDQPSTFQVPGMLGWSAADFLFSPRYFRGDTTARVDVASALISGNGGCTRLRQPAVLVKVAHSAANAGSVQTLQAVLQIAGSQQDTILSSRDESERNLLHAAADQGHSNVVTLVCETGAGMQELLRQADSQSLLPAHYAARGGHPNILVAIGQLGFADTFCVPDHRGRTAIQLAVERGHSGHGGDDCVAACLSFDPSKTMLRTIKTMDLDIRASGLRARCRGIVNYAPARQLCIDRSSIIFATLELIKDIAADNLRDPIKIEFAGEAGSDAGGLTREFFKCFGESLAVPNEKGLRLFRLSTRGMLVPCSSVLLAAQHSTVAVAQHDGVVSLLESEPESISPSEQQLDDTLVAHFVAAGRVAGMALLHGELLGRPFAPYFIRLVCNDPPKCLADLQAEFSAAEVAGPDHGDIRGSSEILQRTLSDLHLDDTLTMTRTLTGSKVEVELVPNGADIAVTNLNKTEWLQRSLHHKIVRDIQRQADAFRQGVLQVLPEGLLDWFTAEELAKLWGGHSIDDHQLAAWQANTRVDAASEQEAELLWAWLAVQACERRAQVLAFITGSSTIPIEGFSSLHPPLCIIREEQPTVIKGMPVPTVSTCFNALVRDSKSTTGVVIVNWH
jgi:ankyrin repeat protein